MDNVEKSGFWERFTDWKRSPAYRHYLKRRLEKHVAMLGQGNKDVRDNAGRALEKMGETAALVLIEAMKDESDIAREDAVTALGKIGCPSAVPTLIESLMDKDIYTKGYAAWALAKIVEKCGTIEELEKVEKGIDKGLTSLRKGKVVKTALINNLIKIARLTREIAEKKDELAPKRDLLLDDKPKPPKKGRGVYHTTRMIRNG